MHRRTVTLGVALTLLLSPYRRREPAMRSDSSDAGNQ